MFELFKLRVRLIFIRTESALLSQSREEKIKKTCSLFYFASQSSYHKGKRGKASRYLLTQWMCCSGATMLLFILQTVGVWPRSFEALVQSFTRADSILTADSLNVDGALKAHAEESNLRE